MRISPQLQKKKKVYTGGWADTQAVPPGLTDNSCPSRINLAHPSRHPLNKYFQVQVFSLCQRLADTLNSTGRAPPQRTGLPGGRVRHWASRPVFIPGLGSRRASTPGEKPRSDLKIRETPGLSHITRVQPWAGSPFEPSTSPSMRWDHGADPLWDYVRLGGAVRENA